MSIIIHPEDKFVNSSGESLTNNNFILRADPAAAGAVEKLHLKNSSRFIPQMRGSLEQYSASSNTKIVFMGTPEFSVPILEKLIQSEYKPATVFCAPDKPVGRKQFLTPPPVKVIAQKYNIPVFQPRDVSSFKFQVSSLKPELIITAAYSLILPKEVLETPQFGCINVHPSLLPKYRGPSPIQTAILNGDAATGVTIYKMDEQIDHGTIIAQEKIQIKETHHSDPAAAGEESRGSEATRATDIIRPTTPELSQKLSNLSSELLLKTLPDWLAGKITPMPQDDSQATYTKIITKEDGKIDWRKSAQAIERQIRAYTPWPGAYASLTDYRLPTAAKLKILQADIFFPPYAKGGWGVSAPLTQRGVGGFKFLSSLRRLLFPNPLNPPLQWWQKRQPGEIFLTDANDLAFQTGDGSLIIKTLQLEGGKGKILSAQDFLRGHKDTVGQILT